ncbi:MAG TPA: cytochrome c-type biogenesis protein CcmH [Baekduia sp.]|nr:cytochrome c-type biogenesis protein CcmH [Baekduia sp.]
MPRLLLLLVVMLVSLTAPAYAATSYTDVEDELMCVSCNVPLNVAESPQAEDERAALRSLVAKGLTKDQVLDEMVAQYGKRVLATPPDDGFGVAVYVVPIAVVLALLGLAAFLAPKWRSRSAGHAPVPSPISPAQSSRLEAELKQYDR